MMSHVHVMWLLIVVYICSTVYAQILCFVQKCINIRTILINYWVAIFTQYVTVLGPYRPTGSFS